jgi:hypothetical protein
MALPQIPKAPEPLRPAPASASMFDYLKEAFLFRWNLLCFLGSTAAAAIVSPDVLLPLVAAGEMAYLAGLISIPGFRAAIDAKVAGEASPGTIVPPPLPQPSPLVPMLRSLPMEARKRFERLHERSRDMGTIAAGVRGTTGIQSGAEGSRAPGLDRLLWLFLRLLVSKAALDRFLQAINEKDISASLEQLRATLATAQQSGDERVTRSLQDSIAMAELRLDNYHRAQKNAQFVVIELDRIEHKIQALSEMAVNSQDPNFLSSQVDSAAESMRQTEKAMTELQHLTGVAEAQQAEPPAILESDLREVLTHDA